MDQRVRGGPQLGLPQNTSPLNAIAQRRLDLPPYSKRKMCEPAKAGLAFPFEKRYARANPPVDSEEAHWRQGHASVPLPDAFASTELGAEKMTPKPRIPSGSEPPASVEVGKVKGGKPQLETGLSTRWFVFIL